MRLLVILAGVLDPKWPLEPGPDGLPRRGGDRLVLSPFDEAALELALRLRDQRPETGITAMVCGGAESDKLLRAVAAYNLAFVVRADFDPAGFWDVQAASAGLRAAITGLEPFDLILVGREMGDCDDGALPAHLARVLGRDFCGLVQDVAASGAVELMRERAGVEEQIAVDRPLLASVTNDRRNRLRRPLMKNVMAARQARFEVLDVPFEPSSGLDLRAAPMGARRQAGACRMLSGPAAAQAAELAAALRTWAET